MSRRTVLVGVAVWLVVVSVAAWISWRAIDSAGQQVVAPVTAAPSTPDLSADSPSVVGSSTPSATAVTATPTVATTVAPAVRTVTSHGGTAAARCDGTAAVVDYATPAVGWRVEIEPGHGEDARVDFRSEDGRVRITFSCASGQVEFTTDEDDDSSGEG